MEGLGRLVGLLSHMRQRREEDEPRPTCGTARRKRLLRPQHQDHCLRSFCVSLRLQMVRLDRLVALPCLLRLGEASEKTKQAFKAGAWRETLRRPSPQLPRESLRNEGVPHQLRMGALGCMDWMHCQLWRWQTAKGQGPGSYSGTQWRTVSRRTHHGPNLRNPPMPN